FLRPEYIRSTMFTIQNIRYIAGHSKGTVFKFFTAVSWVYRMNLKQRSAAIFYRGTFSIIKRKSQSLQHTDTPVVSRTAAESDDEFSRTLIISMINQLTDTISR